MNDSIAEIPYVGEKMTKDKNYRWIYHFDRFLLLDEDNTLYASATDRSSLDRYTAEKKADGFKIDDKSYLATRREI